MIQVGKLAVLCAAVVVLALSSGAGQAAPRAQALALTYDVSVYGVRAMRWEVTLARDDDGYATQFRARASGLPSLVSDLSIHARAGGRQSDGGLRPRSYASRLLDGSDTRSVLIAYGAHGPVMTRAEPPAREDEREVVPEDALTGALDPLAGAHALLREVAGTGVCEGEVAIFDGRRLFHASLEAVAGQPREDAMQCRVTLDKVAGFKAKERRDNRFPDELLVELAPAGPDGELLPVRITADHHVGPVIITLADARAASEAVAVRRNDTLAWQTTQPE